jgi:D-serine dehydratase
MVNELAINELTHRPLEPIHKALPPGTPAISIQEIGKRGWHALKGDLPWPILLLKESAIRHNVELMAAFCREHGFEFAPHGKTTMAPQLVEMQIAAGAWGVTTATATQTALYHRFGVSRFVLANQLLDPAGVAWVTSALLDDPELELYCLVDSVAGVERLNQLITSASTSVQVRVLIEIGWPSRRAGCRSLEQALEVARAVQQSEHLVLAGIEGFEGVIGHDRSETSLREVSDYLVWMKHVTEELIADGAFEQVDECIVTAGGSAFPDLVVEHLGKSWKPTRSLRRILRSGGYLTHDHGLLADISPFTDRAGSDRKLVPAMEVWGVVLSRPDPGLAILGFGKRDVPFDISLPIPIAVWLDDGSIVEPDPAWKLTSLNDQHAMMEVPSESSLHVGQLIGFGISHPCTAFDKWTLIPMVDDEYHVVGAIRTFF